MRTIVSFRRCIGHICNCDQYNSVCENCRDFTDGDNSVIDRCKQCHFANSRK